jgi:hypothetical protein
MGVRVGGSGFDDLPARVGRMTPEYQPQYVQASTAGVRVFVCSWLTLTPLTGHVVAAGRGGSSAQDPRPQRAAEPANAFMPYVSCLQRLSATCACLHAFARQPGRGGSYSDLAPC